MISEDLQSAYDASQEAGELDGGPSYADGSSEMTPDVKQMISDEVRAQLAIEELEAQQAALHEDSDPASSGIAYLLADGRPHVFVAGGALDLIDENGRECSISDGDVLSLRHAPPAYATAVNLVVLASKGGPECRKNSVVMVPLNDLQEMQNQMRATIDQGLQQLQAAQGRDGMPQAPPEALTRPITPDYVSVAPPADSSDAVDLQREAQQADQAERDVTRAAPAPSASVELGESFDQVQATLGPPERVANLASKVIYFYSGMKVVFTNGRVSDVQ
jgi:hypothetical protein